MFKNIFNKNIKDKNEKENFLDLNSKISKQTRSFNLSDDENEKKSLPSETPSYLEGKIRKTKKSEKKPSEVVEEQSKKDFFGGKKSSEVEEEKPKKAFFGGKKSSEDDKIGNFFSNNKKLNQDDNEFEGFKEAENSKFPFSNKKVLGIASLAIVLGGFGYFALSGGNNEEVASNPIPTTPMGGDPTQMPMGGDPTQMPMGGDPTQMPMGGDPTQMPMGGDPTQMPMGGEQPVQNPQNEQKSKEFPYNNSLGEFLVDNGTLKSITYNKKFANIQVGNKLKHFGLTDEARQKISNVKYGAKIGISYFYDPNTDHSIIFDVIYKFSKEDIDEYKKRQLERKLEIQKAIEEFNSSMEQQGEGDMGQSGGETGFPSGDMGQPGGETGFPSGDMGQPGGGMGPPTNGDTSGQGNGSIEQPPSNDTGLPIPPPPGEGIPQGEMNGQPSDGEGIPQGEMNGQPSDGNQPSAPPSGELSTPPIGDPGGSTMPQI